MSERLLVEAVRAAASISRTYETEYAGRLSESKPHLDDCAWLKIDAANLSLQPVT